MSYKLGTYDTKITETHQEKNSQSWYDTFSFYISEDSYKSELRGFSPQTNYTDRATAACRRS
jgi:hypothetical protein